MRDQLYNADYMLSIIISHRFVVIVAGSIHLVQNYRTGGGLGASHTRWLVHHIYEMNNEVTHAKLQFYYKIGRK